jgi:peptidoglycan/LPS O-acetylase OafA/YrhL
MTAPVHPPRYHALDSLRGFAMFLGVALHAAMSFLATDPGFWPVRDNHPTPLADVFLVAVHTFRMQLFFVLAGFFGCLVYRKYGLAGAVVHRLKRIAIPLVLGLALIVPTLQAVGVYCEVERVRTGAAREVASPLRPLALDLIAAHPDASTGRLVAGYFASGDALAHLPLVHLWFLYYLLIFLAAAVALTPVLGRLTGTRLLATVDAAFRFTVESRWRVLVPALLTFPLMLPMTWIVDTPFRWNPQWHVVGYYSAFFLFGWMLYRHRDLVATFGRGWRVNLAVANLLVLPAMVGAIAAGVSRAKGGGDPLGWEPAGFAAAALYTWLMIAGLWGAFLRLFARESAWVRYLADASYWCYLTSITPLVGFQYLVKDWDLEWPVKFALVTGATMAVLLASYEWCVRYTVVGAVLNGRKYRVRSEAAVAPDVVPARPEEARV